MRDKTINFIPFSFFLFSFGFDLYHPDFILAEPEQIDLNFHDTK
jgi:hypothetical protein